MLKRLVLVMACFACTAMASAFAQSVDIKWQKKDGTILKQEVIDLAAFDKLPQHEIKTATPWTEGVQRYSGPLLSDLAELGGMPIAEASITALNDYTIVIPATDWASYPLILASRAGGDLMRVRDKGPFWVVYPLDDYADLNNQFYHSRMIWQVKDIVFIGN